MRSIEQVSEQVAEVIALINRNDGVVFEIPPHWVHSELTTSGPTSSANGHVPCVRGGIRIDSPDGNHARIPTTPIGAAANTVPVDATTYNDDSNPSRESPDLTMRNLTHHTIMTDLGSHVQLTMNPPAQQRPTNP